MRLARVFTFRTASRRVCFVEVVPEDAELLFRTRARAR